jgi:hypothetical protein
MLTVRSRVWSVINVRSGLPQEKTRQAQAVPPLKYEPPVHRVWQDIEPWKSQEENAHCQIQGVFFLQ